MVFPWFEPIIKLGSNCEIELRNPPTGTHELGTLQALTENIGRIVSVGRWIWAFRKPKGQISLDNSGNFWKKTNIQPNSSDFVQTFGLYDLILLLSFTICFCSEFLPSNVGFARCPLKQKWIFMDLDQHVIYTHCFYFVFTDFDHPKLSFVGV